MDTSTLFMAALISAIIWAMIIYSIVSSASRSKTIVNLLTLIAEKQGATEGEIFIATKSKDEIYAREREDNTLSRLRKTINHQLFGNTN